MRIKGLLVFTLVVLLLPIIFCACGDDSDSPNTVNPNTVSPTIGSPTPDSPIQKEIEVGFLVPRTGDWASLGKTSEAALDIATTDINNFLEEIEYPAKLNIIAEDTQTDPSVALEKLKILQSRGIKFVIGPASSAEVVAISDYASQNGILIVSYGSTAPSLEKRNENIYRFALSDTYEAQRLAQLINEDGISAVIPLARGDVWGDGYIEALSESFQSLSGVVVEGVRYSPNTSDFSGVLTELSTKVSEAITTYGQDKVAVLLTALSETSDILSQASRMDSIIQNIGWYGTGGSAFNNIITDDTQVAQFAAETEFRCLVFSAKDFDATQELAAQVKSKTGYDLDGYTAAAYDAASLITRSYLLADETDGDTESLRSAFMSLAGVYYGLTGDTSLDSDGDRKSGWFQLWTVNLDGNTASWHKMDQFLITY